MQQPLVLASSSPYRSQLLRQLGLSFTTCSPDIDESRQAGERVEDLVLRLAMEKAAAVAAKNEGNACILAADQLAATGDDILGKPGDVAVAKEMLRSLSGKRVSFMTGVALMTPDGSIRQCRSEVRALYRKLEDNAIDWYLRQEPEAVRCAAAMRSEGLGVTLLEEVSGNEPGALIGLPLLSVCNLLRQAGFNIL